MRGLAIGLIGCLLCACGGDGGGAVASFPAVVHPADNLPNPAKIRLGRLLFHDPILSSDGQVACVTCHSQIWGMSDGLPRSVGIDGVGPAGTGRSGPNVTRRNAQTLWNVAFVDDLMWDGRAASLEEQILLPLANKKELGRAAGEVVADLARIPEYVELFAAAFPNDVEPLSAANMLRAIAAFERTLISDNAPWDQHQRGIAGALSSDAIAGMEIFSAAGCADCHVPPLFASDTFADIGLDRDPQLADLGRGEITGADGDRFAFRTPTLRNIRDTEPYFHDGRTATLAEAVDHGTRDLSRREIVLLVVFLREALTDQTREPDRPRRVPSGLEVPLDGYGIPR